MVDEATKVRVTPPADMSVQLDASPVVARVVISLSCRRPAGVSRAVQEELARPGG